MLRPTYPIKTARLILRPLEHTDLTAFHAVHAHPDVVRYLEWAPRDRTENAKVLAEKVAGAALAEPGETLSLAVELIESGEVVGDLTLHWLRDHEDTGEISVVLHPRHHGRGYAAEATAELLRLGFEELGLRRIFGRCDERNIASASLMEGLGMRLEPHLGETGQVKGEWINTLVYAMLATEWQRG